MSKHCCCHDDECSIDNHSHEHSEDDMDIKKSLVIIAISLLLFIGGLFAPTPYSYILLLLSYLIVGYEILERAVKNIFKGKVFDENFLMAIATVGAIAIGDYKEAVAVMIFYQTGEFFSDLAVDRSRRSISELMDIRPDSANLIEGDSIKVVSPESVKINDIILVSPGEKVPLDGEVIDGNSLLQTSSLTGESVPLDCGAGDKVLAGFINQTGVIKIKVTALYGESTVSKILKLVENANQNKAQSEKFISRFARIYTPIVVGLAFCVAFLPPILGFGTVSSWLYRALTFLVISCPCALVISIPLTYFAAIGKASKLGVLIKGGNFLDVLLNLDTIAFDKTGTLTKGTFTVTSVVTEEGVTEEELLLAAVAAEQHSTHPVATSILKFANCKDIPLVSDYIEEAGHGINAIWDNKVLLAGNKKHLLNNGVAVSDVDTVGTVIYIAVGHKLLGHFIIADTLKENIVKDLIELKSTGIKTLALLSGDKQSVVEHMVNTLNKDYTTIDIYESELLPDKKISALSMLQHSAKDGMIAFVGDGINDAPVLTHANLGIAMGGLGSDAAIEAADIVLLNDNISAITKARNIAKKTNIIAKQNIAFALGFKFAVMALSIFGFASMWLAVFADVGVALLAVLNSTRLLKTKV